MSDFVLAPQDGTWSTILKTFDIVMDVRDACFHTYFSVMDDLRQDGLPNGKYYEIRFDSMIMSLIMKAHLNFL